MTQLRRALSRQIDLIQESLESSDLPGKLPTETLSKWKDLLQRVNQDSEPVLQDLRSVLQVGKVAGIPRSKLLTEVAAEVREQNPPSVDTDNFYPAVPLPDSLMIKHLREAMELTQQRLFRINFSLLESDGDSLFNSIQTNNYSGVVSNILTKSLAEVSPFDEFHEQRHPDLKDGNGVGLEVKAANKAWKKGEGHNGHGGWHMVAGFHTDETTGAIRFVHIQIAELEQYQKGLDKQDRDWTYRGSTWSEGSMRNETFDTTPRGTAKLRDGTVYIDPERTGSWKHKPHFKSDNIPPYSPLYFRSIDEDREVPALNSSGKALWKTVRPQLHEEYPSWALRKRSELMETGIPDDLVDVICPPIE